MKFESNSNTWPFNPRILFSTNFYDRTEHHQIVYRHEIFSLIPSYFVIQFELLG